MRNITSITPSTARREARMEALTGDTLRRVRLYSKSVGYYFPSRINVNRVVMGSWLSHIITKVTYLTFFYIFLPLKAL